MSSFLSLLLLIFSLNLYSFYEIYFFSFFTYAAKTIGAGLATIGVVGAGAGIGIVLLL